MKPFEYASPATVEEALSLLGRDGTPAVNDGTAQGHDGALRPLAGTQPFAGGTDLLTLVKAGVASPVRLVNVKRLAGLSGGIQETAGGLTLGALTTLSEIETNPVVQRRYTALAEAVAEAATPQLRNMATIGGNLLQRPRCWYFRSPRFLCWLKGGDECQARDGENQFHALFGDGTCVAVHPSDPAPALLALGAEVRLRGPRGERTLPLADLFALPEESRRTETIVRQDELILSVHLPLLPDGTRSVYLKAMDRKVWAFALVGVAAVLRLDGTRIEEARLVLGGVAPIPWRARAAEQVLAGAQASEDLFARAAEAALAGAHPLEHNAYKVPLAKSLIRRALRRLTSAS